MRGEYSWLDLIFEYHPVRIINYSFEPYTEGVSVLLESTVATILVPKDIKFNDETLTNTFDICVCACIMLLYLLVTSFKVSLWMFGRFRNLVSAHFCIGNCNQQILCFGNYTT